ncbi:MAG: xanthine dehydrogenase family protein molybdopterin-binding subunit [Acidimicrobiia bacterium]|nr:xanthine dehydrogenase family protein molybdopterin-binding subunit [Acidimicrobiia bacterium]
MTTYVGNRVARVDSVDKVTGRAVYGVDVALPGMLHGAVVRSPYPHARIVSIDTSAAERAPGVVAVATGKDFPHLFGAAIKDQPFLAIDRVRYVGDPVVAVAATSEREAQYARDLVRVEYEELPAITDMQMALDDDAPLVHPDLHTYERGGHEIVPHTNINTLYHFERGDVDAAFAEADHVFEAEYSAHALSHVTLEVHVAVAQYDTYSGDYTLWVTTDRPYFLRDDLAGGLGVDGSKIRLKVAQVGGSFGAKGVPIAEAIAVMLARKTSGRPVKVELTREECLIASQLRVPAIMKLKTGVTNEGFMIARSADVLWDSGAYTAYTVGVAIRGSQTIVGPYRIPNVKIRSRQVYTNKAITGSYRGYGTTQVTWACESQMDEIANELGIDPVVFRLQNGYEEGDPYLNGQIMHGVGLRETIETARDEIGWGSVERKPAPHLRRGKGLATMIKPTLTPSSSNVVINLGQDGRVQVVCAAPEVGSGQDTVLAQMAADAVGVPIDVVSVPATDTALTPYNGPVASSRTTYHMGNAIVAAGAEIREKVLGLAADFFGTDADYLEMYDGEIRDENGELLITLKDLLARHQSEGYALTAGGRYSSTGSPLLKANPGEEWISSIFWMLCTQAAEIEVDTETGVIRVIKVAASADVGKAINPMTCEQQVEGGVVMGLSNGLFEDFKIDNGRIENASLVDYKVATIEDMPEIVPILVESVHNEAPFGAKGIGEPAAAATPPAIANALFDAVGIRIRDLPITPEKVLAALAEKAATEPGD